MVVIYFIFFVILYKPNLYLYKYNLYLYKYNLYFYIQVVFRDFPAMKTVLYQHENLF